MKNILIAMMAMGFSGAAMADGFVCQSLNGIYNVKVYNHTDASRGTRTGSIMVISDNRIQSGRKTVATFEAEKTLVSGQGAKYEANVDLRYSTSNRAGENVFGTKLGELDVIKLAVAYNYSQPVPAGQELDAQIVAVKRNGAKSKLQMVCTRYLKN